VKNARKCNLCSLTHSVLHEARSADLQSKRPRLIVNHVTWNCCYLQGLSSSATFEKKTNLNTKERITRRGVHSRGKFRRKKQPCLYCCVRASVILPIHRLYMVCTKVDERHKLSPTFFGSSISQIAVSRKHGIYITTYHLITGVLGRTTATDTHIIQEISYRYLLHCLASVSIFKI
jgi:hypothetical protein